MLQFSKAFLGFSVNDLQKAKQFYGETLELNIKDSPMGILELHFEGGSHAIVYPKPNHEPATYTILNFPVEDLDKAVDELTKKGVKFEQYPAPLKTNEKGIFKSPDDKMPDHAWFKDPAGNILTLLKQK